MPNKHDNCSCGNTKDTRAKMCRDCSMVAPKDHLARLMRKVSIAPDGCWNFTGFKLPNGYGRIQGFSRPVLAHRFSYELHLGTIPDGLCVCHKCDNRKCVNPDHLFLGTHKENLQDMVDKGRARPHGPMPKTRNMAHWNAKLTPEQINEIRSRRNEPRKKLAVEFGISARYASSIICGKKRRYA